MMWLFATVPGRLVTSAVAVVMGSFLMACAGYAGVGCIGLFLAVGLTILSVCILESQTP
jgi:hypothetical protein